MRRLRSPALALLLLAPIVAEVLPGATPPIVFLLFPPIALWETLLYGCGALIVRQITKAWGGGWWTVLLLGAAYGLIEEGLSLKVIFNTAFEPAGALATYGRVGEIASVFATQVIVYHAVVSIAIPILLVELAFPSDRGRQWLGRKALAVVCVLWLLALVFGYTNVHPEAPPSTYPLVIAATAVLVAIAWSLRHLRAGTALRSGKRWLLSFAVALLGTVIFLGVTWGGPEAGRPAGVSVLLQLAVVAVTVTALRLSGRDRPFADLDRLALAAGVLSVFIVADLFKPAGAPLLAIVAAVALFALGRRVHRRAESAGILAAGLA